MSRRAALAARSRSSNALALWAVNRHRSSLKGQGFVMFTPLDFDKPRNLRFDITACLALEGALNATLGEVVMRLNQLSITSTCAALWAGFKHEDPTLNLSSVSKKLQAYLEQGGELKTINDALNKALADSAPLKAASADDEESEGNAAPEPAAIC